MYLSWMRVLSIVVALAATGGMFSPDSGVLFIDKFITACGHTAGLVVALCEFFIALFQLILSSTSFISPLLTSSSVVASLRYTGKVFVITGASSGLGADVALLAASQGASLLLAARRLDRLQEVKLACLQAGAGQVEILVMDAVQATSSSQLVEKVYSTFGRLDVLILNAGIPGPWTRFENLTEISLLERVMNVNFWAYVKTTRLALPMLKKSRGHIVVVSSMYGHISAPFQAGYCASKHALTGFFESLRQELRGEVGITVHSPGGVATEVQSRFQDSTGHGAVLSMPSSFLASSPACARSILHAFDTRASQTFYPPLATGLVQSKLAFGEWFDWMYFHIVEEYSKFGIMALTSSRE